MVLCVDDDSAGLRIRRMFLESLGYKVLTALDGTAGLELLATQPVHAVVLDYLMPGMNGGEVAEAMKRLKPEVKILLYSAYVNLPDEALRWVDRSAVKGIGPAEFVEALRQILPCEKSSDPAC